MERNPECRGHGTVLTAGDLRAVGSASGARDRRSPRGRLYGTALPSRRVRIFFSRHGRLIWYVGSAELVLVGNGPDEAVLRGNSTTGVRTGSLGGRGILSPGMPRRRFVQPSRYETLSLSSTRKGCRAPRQSCVGIPSMREALGDADGALVPQGRPCIADAISGSSRQPWSLAEVFRPGGSSGGTHFEVGAMRSRASCSPPCEGPEGTVALLDRVRG